MTTDLTKLPDKPSEPRIVELHAVGLKDTPELRCQVIEHEYMRAALLRNRDAVDALWCDLRTTDPALAERIGKIGTDLRLAWLFRCWPCPKCAEPCERSAVLADPGPSFMVYECESCGPIRMER
jgi:hypothetical protein